MFEEGFVRFCRVSINPVKEGDDQSKRKSKSQS